MDQNIIGYSRDKRNEWYALAHFVKKSSRVTLALRLVVNYTGLNSCLIRDQAQAFPTREEIRQHLRKECKVWATSNALAAYFQIDMDKRDQHKTTFALPPGRYLFRKTVMGQAELGILAEGER